MSLIHKFKQGENYFVLDVNTGAVHVVDELVYDILDDSQLRNRKKYYRNLKENMMKKRFQRLMMKFKS